MYHTMYPPHMLVQTMVGQQGNGQFQPAQMHAAHTTGTNSLHQTEYNQYVQDGNGQNRHCVVQVYFLFFFSMCLIFFDKCLFAIVYSSIVSLFQFWI